MSDPRRELVLAGATGLLVTAALVGLDRVFASDAWRGVALLALLLALMIAAVARRAGAGAVVSALTSALGLALFVDAVHLPPGGLLPDGDQLRAARELLVQGLVQMRLEPAPTLPLPGLMLLVTGGTWIVTHLTHELLVRSRRAGLALVPPIVLWAVPLSVPLPPGRTWPQVVPLLAAAVLVLLLQADSDVAGWTTDATPTRPSGTGLAVGVVAVVVAVVVPGVLPGYGAEPWLEIAGGTDPRGYQPIVDVGDRLSLPQERDVLEVRADRRVYLRLAGLDTFDGVSWRLGPTGEASYRPDPEALFRTTGPLPAETPLGEADETAVSVEVLDLENIYVPVPYQPVRIGGPHRDEMVYSTEGGFVATWQTGDNEIGGELRVGVRDGFQYQVVSAVPRPSIEQLRDVEVAAADPDLTQLPGDYTQLRAQAEQVYAAAGATTAVDRALALQAWFAGPESTFAYDLDVPGLRGDAALTDFVFGTQRGYCEYFATAMAVMLRATGIPARVAVGFLPGAVTEEADADTPLTTFTVSTSDAHAWVEVLFPDYGWIRFEPTPRSDGGVMVPTAGNLDPALTERERRAAELQEQAESEDSAAEGGPAAGAGVDDPDAGLQQGLGVGVGGGQDAGGAGIAWLVAAVTVVLAALVLAGGVALQARRLRHVEATSPPVARVLAAQRRLHGHARRYGVGRDPSETAADVASRWVAEGRTAVAPSARFATLAQSAAFGGDVGVDDGVEASRLADELTGQLRGSVESRDRLMAPVRVPAGVARDGARTAARRARELVGTSRDR